MQMEHYGRSLEVRISMLSINIDPQSNRDIQLLLELSASIYSTWQH